MSVVFLRPELVVATYELSLVGDVGQQRKHAFPLTPVLVKGCERRFAIEECGTLRLSTPSYYQEERESLVWDTQEGLLQDPPRSEERWDDPADLEEQRRIDAGKGGRLPLAEATDRVTTTQLKVVENEESYFTYGDNCLIWCSSIKPRTNLEWTLWRDSLESSYDHVSEVRDPDGFAEALGVMAFQQKGLLGDAVSFRNPRTGHVIECPSLPVVYGPVVYTEDRRAFIDASSSDFEFVVRSIFTKTSEHRHQREYRFAILGSEELGTNTVDLIVSPLMQQSLRQRRDPGALGGVAVPAFKGREPSPRVRQAFSEQSASRPGSQRKVTTLTTQIRPSLHLAGVLHKYATKTRRAVQTVEEVDYESIDQAISKEPTSPSDARIVKLVLRAGPGTTIGIYDLGGIRGTFRLVQESGKAILRATIADPESGEGQVLVNNSEFDGTSLLSGETDQLTLSYTPVNPETDVRTALSDTDDTVITVTATSEDGTAESSFEIVFDRSLGLNVTPLP